MNKTAEPTTPLSVRLDRLVIQRCKDNAGTSIKDSGLLILFGGNPMTVERRASRRLAKLCKAGELRRKKICLEARSHDGTRWMYAYEAV